MKNKNTILILSFITSLYFSVTFSQESYTVTAPPNSEEKGLFGRSGLVGDLNNDGINDLLITKEGTFSLSPDELYIILGPLNYTNDFAVTDENDFLITIDLESENDMNKYNLIDFNNDGIDDLFVSPSFGRAYVFYGPITSSLTHADANVKFLTDITTTITALNDITGNGHPDVAVSKNNETVSGEGNVGKVRIYQGSFNGEIVLGNDSFTSIEGEDSGDAFGNTLTLLPDMNGDSLNEVYVSSLEWGNCIQINPATGLCDVFENRDTGDGYIFFSPFTAGSLTVNDADIKFNGPNNSGNVVGFGNSISTGFDFNGDGENDIAFGSNRGNKAYVFHGPFLASDYSVDSNSFTITGGAGTFSTTNTIERFGFSISGIKDLDGNGSDELLIGAPSFSHEISFAYPRRWGRVYQVNGPINTNSTSAQADVLLEGSYIDHEVGINIYVEDVNNDTIKDINIASNTYWNSSEGGTWDIFIIENTLSVSEIGYDMNQVTLYPNPASENVNVISKLPITSIDIFDVTGKYIQSFSQIQKINLNNFSKGVYFLKVKLDSDNKIVSTKKLIIK